DARARLDAAGVTLALAEEAAAAVRPEVITAYALGDVVKAMAPRLGAYELFEGRTYDAQAQCYDGAWLDLRALSNDLAMPGAGLALRALQRAAAMAEIEPGSRVVLQIEGAGQKRADRAFQRVPSDYVRKLLAGLRALRPTGPRARAENAEQLRTDLAALVRDR